MKKLISTLIIAVLVGLTIGQSEVFAAGKITLSPATPAILEGQSQAFGIQLDTALPAGRQVTITITSSNPETATMLPSSIVFTSADWFQTKYFTADVPHNGTYGDTRNIMILARVNSNMAYYDGFAGTASLHVTDMTPEPGESEPQDPPPADDDPEEEIDQEEETTSNNPTTENEVAYDRGTGYAAPQYLTTAQADKTWPGDSNLNSQTALAKIGRITDVFTPGQKPIWQIVLWYLGLATCMLLLILIPLNLRRKKWWGRQRARDLRWYYRHVPSAQKPSPRKKKATKPAKKRR